MYDLILKSVAAYIQLDKREEEIFKSVLQHRTLRKRQYLLQAGDVARLENFVIKVCLRAYTVDQQANEHMAMFGAEGWWITDLYSFLTNTPAIQTVDAVEDSEVLSI